MKKVIVLIMLLGMLILPANAEIKIERLIIGGVGLYAGISLINDSSTPIYYMGWVLDDGKYKYVQMQTEKSQFGIGGGIVLTCISTFIFIKGLVQDDEPPKPVSLKLTAPDFMTVQAKLTFLF